MKLRDKRDTGGVYTGLVNGNAMRIPLADGVVQCSVFSIPYWGLRSYGIGPENGELGLEPLHDCGGWVTGERCGECFICHAVEYMREVKRVLRDDGVVFCNIGDSYAQSTLRHRGGVKEDWGERLIDNDYSTVVGNLKPKDLCLIPQRLALALQADGWWVRSEIIWHKPNPMPESVTDRPTKSHEQVWLLTKNDRYYWDAEAVRQPNAREWDDTNIGPNNRINTGEMTGKVLGRDKDPHCGLANTRPNPAGRNLRDVWKIATQSYSGAHYATYPEALVERCLKAGTSERGACVKCGKAWTRIVEKEVQHINNTEPRVPVGQTQRGWNEVANTNTTTLGWRPDCECGTEETRPCLVFDPFAGSGTTLLVAKRMGLSAVGLDLSYEYLKENAWKRIGMDQPVLF